MIHHLTGRMVRKTPTEVILEVAGIGYEIAIPLSTYETLPEGGEVTLLIRQITRNEQTSLYGFSTNEERDVFRMVTSVQGVGPSGAISLLSTLSPSMFRTAVSDQDLASLMRSKGIGKKTASRISTELQDKVGVLPLDGEAPVASRQETAVAALVNLGFSRREAQGAVQKAEQALPRGAAPEELIRHSLQNPR